MEHRDRTYYPSSQLTITIKDDDRSHDRSLPLSPFVENLSSLPPSLAFTRVAGISTACEKPQLSSAVTLPVVVVVVVVDATALNYDFSLGTT